MSKEQVMSRPNTYARRTAYRPRFYRDDYFVIKHLAEFVNGSLRALARSGPPWSLPDGDDATSIGIRLSHPDWVVDTLVDQFGPDDALATLTIDNEPPLVTLRVNRARATP